MEVGNRIKHLRKLKSLTQGKMAELIGITQQHLSRVEKGNSGLSFEQLSKIASVFKLNLNWLITGEGDIFIVNVVDYELKRLLDEVPELKVLAEKAIKQDDYSVIRNYISIASSHKELSSKFTHLTKKEIKERIELILRLV